MADSHGAHVLMPAVDWAQTVERQRVFLDFAEANGRLYFSVVDTEFSAAGVSKHWITREVWTSDGTQEGTSLLTKFGPLEVSREYTPFAFRASGGLRVFPAARRTACGGPMAHPPAR